VNAVASGVKETLYRIAEVPSDTCLRERLDKLDARQLRRPFKKIFAHLQRGKALESYRYLGGHYLISLDGTGQYASKQVSCKNCCEKKHKDGSTTYYHHMLGAALVHPEHKVVIPLAPEPIGVKPGDHEYLFDWIKALKATVYSKTDAAGMAREFKCYRDVPLNDTHHDYRVNVMVYTETLASGKQQHFSWVTKLEITEENAEAIMKAGRARWRVGRDGGSRTKLSTR
jgi:hypothetical protein